MALVQWCSGFLIFLQIWLHFFLLLGPRSGWEAWLGQAASPEAEWTECRREVACIQHPGSAQMSTSFPWIFSRHFASRARIACTKISPKSMLIFVPIAGTKIFLKPISIFISTALISHLRQWLELSVPASVRRHQTRPRVSGRKMSAHHATTFALDKD